MLSNLNFQYMRLLNISFSTILICFMFISPLFSQDRIVLSNGDTLNCTIYRENKSYLFFRYDLKGVISTGKIPKSQLFEWTYGNRSIQKETVQKNKLPDELALPRRISEKPVETTEPINRIRFNVSGGPAFLIGNTKGAKENLANLGISHSSSDSYYNKLLSGYSANGNVYYRISKDYWMGIMYQGFYTNSSMKTEFLMYDPSHNFYGEMSEKFFVNYPGLSLYSSSLIGKSKQLSLHTSYSAGPVFYRNEGQILTQQLLITGITAGQSFSLGTEYFITRRMSLNLSGNLFLARMKVLTIKTTQSTQKYELEKEQYENLSRVDLSAGIVFYL